MRAINQAGVNLIKSFESFRSAPYKDEAGVWTVGYGHTEGVTANTRPVTAADAEELLRQDLQEAQGSLEQMIKVPLNDNQYAALVSLVFNTGGMPLKRLLGARLNAGDYAGAAQEFLRWRVAGGRPSEGLLRRREAERALFLST